MTAKLIYTALAWLLGVGFLLTSGCGSSSDTAANPADNLSTVSPIKHVLIIVGENRSFDHLFATYQPRNPHVTIRNLLSEQIVTAAGQPGPRFDRAQQYRIVSAPNGGRYFISANSAHKELYPSLPPPDVNGVGPLSPDTLLLSLPGGDPELAAQDQYLFGTGGTGLGYGYGPDTRISNVNALAPGPFQLSGPTLPFDAFTADTIHQFFTMRQQMDCAIDAEHVAADNPTGCRHDLQSAITTTYATPPGTPAHDTGQTMAFYNMQQGDAPLFKSLADSYTISDNYHQPVMGATGPDSVVLGFADQIFFSDGNGHPATPPAGDVYDPDPQPGTLNVHTRPAVWFNCADEAQPGIAVIANYLRSLPYPLQTRCDAGAYWPAVNVAPAFTPSGLPQPSASMPPTTQRSIGDLLSERQISWKYYGGGFNALDRGGPLATYCEICNPFEYEAAYPAMVADHMRDVTDLFTDLQNNTLPAVAWVKPDGWLDGHPGTSKWSLFEAFVRHILELAQADPREWSQTAILITVDEGGGYYDSGFIQPVDFFGTGPRIPMIAVSDYSLGGRVSHVYSEHSSFVKFIERNWRLGTTLSARSRDNLPNPRSDPADPYVPGNMPAIGDLFDLFYFGAE